MKLSRPIKKSVIVNSEQSFSEAKAFLQLAHDSGIAHEFAIKKYTPSRTRTQENTWRGLVRVLADQTGNDTEDMHNQMSVKFGPCRDVKRKTRQGNTVDVRVPISWVEIDVDEADFAIKQLTFFIVAFCGGAGLPSWVLTIHDS